MLRSVLIIVLLLTVQVASSQKAFEVEETETLSLDLELEDPDNDVLTVDYDPPLDENGSWETTYGDEGVYESSIRVSDGENVIIEEIIINVTKKEEPPTIEMTSPEDDEVELDEGQSLSFSIEASDLNDDELGYRWLVNGVFASDEEDFTFETGYNDAGTFTIIAGVFDEFSSETMIWSVTVNDVDVQAILDEIPDVQVSETDSVSLDLPDFDDLGLTYTISEPIGNDNSWKTDYDDAGEYIVAVAADGKDFVGSTEIEVAVENVDRAPEIKMVADRQIREDEEVEIMIEVSDPDGDVVSLQLANAPEDAMLIGDTFTWTPDFNVVEKRNFFDYIAEKFRILSATEEIMFIAESNGLTADESVSIKVIDVNRPFELEPIGDIEVFEGETIVIEPEYTDVDGDKVSFEYSGFMVSNERSTGFDDAGQYVVKIVASDGYFTQTQFINVEVRDVNQAPILSDIRTMTVREGNQVSFSLDAIDFDNDPITFSAENLPKGAVFRGNTFTWTPGFDSANKTTREFNILFIAEDGRDLDQKTGIIFVDDINQAPKIVSTSTTLFAFEDEPIVFEVEAIDPDGDSLTYEWDFGLFDSFEGEPSHERVFTSDGDKRVMVTISDGFEEVVKIWDVTVI